MRLSTRAVVCVAALAIGVLAVGTVVERFLASIFDAPPRAASALTSEIIVRSGQLQPTQETWSDQLRNPAYWAARRGGTAKPSNSPGTIWGLAPGFSVRSNLGIYLAPQPVEQPQPRRSDQSTFRTVCVRLCDGAFFPLSFATTRDNFDADSDRCASSCGTDARLFVYRNPGSDIEDMEDLDGRPYKKLATAFRYKTKYDEACKCRPHPWEEASTNRHKVYALEVAKTKGSKTADAELKDLKVKLRKAEADAAAEKVRVAQAKADAQKTQAAAARTAKAAAQQAAAGKGTKPDDAARAREAAAAVAIPLDPASAKRRASLLAAPSRQASVPALEPGTIIMRLGSTTTIVRITNQSRPVSATR